MFYAVSVHPENRNMYRFFKFDITENRFITENDLSKMKDLYLPYKLKTKIRHYKDNNYNICNAFTEIYKYMNLSANNICSELLNELK